MTIVRENPVEKYLRMERMPSIWCPGCGIGTTVNCFARALDGSGFDLDKVAIVSGIGCTGRVAGYLKLDSFHTTHGRAIPFATGLKLANPELKVVVYSGDGDLSAIGGNHLFHAARRNADLLVVCVNNFTYGMTGGQVTPTTPYPAIASTTPYGAYEQTFNLPGVVAAAGATFVARWTAYHVKQLAKTMGEALSKKGFRFIEIIAPCPTLYLRRNRLGEGLDEMRCPAASCAAAARGVPLRAPTAAAAARRRGCRRLPAPAPWWCWSAHAGGGSGCGSGAAQSRGG
jgi:2-oxoglutarate ferredoxin oxidoreductase subunit beta